MGLKKQENKRKSQIVFRTVTVLLLDENEETNGSLPSFLIKLKE
jgi:hypothetical protein